MPTYDECEELRDNTANLWTTVHGVWGWQCSSNTDASEYMVFPRAGHYVGGSMVTHVNSGVYWTVHLYRFDTDIAGVWQVSSWGGEPQNEYRERGCSVKGVANRVI